jgi:uncharacterized protein (DUF427 family)
MRPGVVCYNAGMVTESVWEYPRPPRVEETGKAVRVVFNGVVIAETRRAKRVLETSHPPVYYIPPDDVRMETLERTERGSVCEWKGQAGYYTVRVGEREAANAAWTYVSPRAGLETIAGYVTFYPAPMDECTVDGERVRPQPGRIYGGWVTSEIAGPFKGEPGSEGW